MFKRLYNLHFSRRRWFGRRGGHLWISQGLGSQVAVVFTTRYCSFLTFFSADDVQVVGFSKEDALSGNIVAELN